MNTTRTILTRCQRAGRRQRRGVIAVRWVVMMAAAAGAVGAAALVLRGGLSKPVAEAGLTFTVVRGPLTISVSESGTIKARQQEIIKSELEGQTTIIYLIPEGQPVKKGELLVELDASKQQDARVDKAISVQNAEANFVSSGEKLAVTKNQAEADVAKAELDFKFAGEDLKKYIDGDYPQAKMQAESNIAMANEDLQRANDKVDWSRKLFKEKYISATELQADELAAKKAKFSVDLAQEAMRLLTDFTYARQVETFNSNVEQTKMALERARRKAAADNVQAEADLKAKDSEFNRQKSQLAKLDQQIGKAKIYAPMDGMVVYASTVQGGRGNSEPLAEGATVRERQDLIYLPTATDMMVEAKVHESSLDKVRPGLPVRVTVDAVPGQTFTGRLTRIAPLPDAQSAWMNPDLKVYITAIDLDGDGSMLRTGMNCRAEIIVDYYPEAVQVPVQSVVRVKGKPTVYVVEAQGPARPVEVDLGMDNNRMAYIKSGLEPGQKVLMSPPMADAEKVDANPTFLSDAEKQMTKQPTSAPTTRPRGRGRGDATGGDGATGMRGEGAGGPTSRPVMTDEERQKVRERMQNMTPEERDRLRQQSPRGGRGGRGAGGGNGGAGGGGAGGGAPEGGANP